jgi:hypothetical protein
MPTDTGTIDIDSSHFANAVVDSSLSSTALTFGSGLPIVFGPFTTAQAAPFILGSDLTKGLALGPGPTGGPADFIVPAFGLVSIINGAGADFAIWEAGAPAEPFLLAVSTDGGVTFSASQSFDTTPTNPLDTSSGFPTNVGFVELSLFGLAPGAQVDAVRVSGLFTGVGGSGPDLLAIAALNAGAPTGNIPEPATLTVLGLGLAGIAFMRRRRAP